MMMLRSAAAIALVSALPATACPAPNVEVVTRYAKPWINYPTLDALNTRYGKQGERTWLGSTASRLQTDVTFKPTVLAQGQSCLPAAMRVDLSFAEHEVNLASEVAGLPCLNKVVLNHELQHVALNQRMLDQLRPAVSHYVARKLPEVLRTAPSETQRIAVTTFVEKDLKGMIERTWGELGTQQAALDTSSEYDRIAATCPGEMDQLAAGLAARPKSR
jgi:hypothetical protein